ncbi:Uncharacterized protein APZ42_031371 [Daphnia magna]|uniref:Uncharacterized protein n=1 Tax=Daphnia magna TaxID=35525 RepID=A0A164MWR0_9CRUS|nr:Uncharacterized protein APZ42_031371 [Daphnia magna]
MFVHGLIKDPVQKCCVKWKAVGLTKTGSPSFSRLPKCIFALSMRGPLNFSFQIIVTA